ncbi:energy transducer TonB [Flavobacterium eburneipallidum]|uniref:energy transducer TonB n=1 Tax=Flavobacterium eburneipallidum TaxID=3003263 RepID=UPI0022AC1F33|nr:energy transducer TonB [Flavobacterium eburneipallidum]
MKKELLTLFLSFYTLMAFAQEVNTTVKKQGSSPEKFPVFPDCENLEANLLEKCFYNEVQDFVFQNFVVPENLTQNNFQGNVKVLFEVDEKGSFKVIYVNAADETLIQEAKRVFGKFPKIKPSTYNGNPTFAQYNITIAIPLKSTEQLAEEKQVPVATTKNTVSKKLTELDSIPYQKFDNPQYKSNLNVPFSHSFYAYFDASMNQVGSNNHTGSKPYTYTEVAKYYDIAAENEKLKKNKSSWWGRKLWNENLVEIKGEDYWFVFNPIVDLQVGTASGNKQQNTFVNTRGVNFSAGLGTQLNFTTTIFESQGRFANYYNTYANTLKPSGGNPAIIPGIGIAKEFKGDAFDFPMAEANLSYTPSKLINLQLGYGRNFIGDGYRSLLESDGASPYPYFKINTTFWKIKYTNTYMWLKDVRPEATVERTYSKKFMANHYLSWNISNKFNLGLFESVIWSNTNDRGFDMYFVNPIIFYRAVEFAASGRTGNALLGLTYKYKWNNQVNLYGQFLIDEFSTEAIKAGNNSWKNKFGYQLGVKYFNAFQVDNLLLQLEYNHVRPYLYSHSDPLTNYANTNQNIGHQWGGNFKEFIAIARYHKGRIFADGKITYGVRGLDFTNSGANSNYGGAIFRDYDVERYADTGVKVGQGNKTNVLIADFQAGYLINPVTNLKLFGSFIYRNFDPMQNTLTAFKENTSWFSLGIRSDVFNWYFDY